MLLYNTIRLCYSVSRRNFGSIFEFCLKKMFTQNSNKSGVNPDDGEQEKRKKLVVELRRRLREKSRGCQIFLEEKKLENDKFLERYLRENKWNLSQAEAMLDHYVTLNEEVGAETLVTREISKELQPFWNCYVGGRDYENRPLVMFPHATPDIRELVEQGDDRLADLYFESLLKYHLTVEKLLLERNVDYSVCITDLSKISYARFLHKKSIDFLLGGIKRVQQHSPGVTGKVIFVNAPKIVKVIARMLQSLAFFSAEIVIYSADEDWKTKLGDHIPKAGISPEFGGTLAEFIKI